MTEATEKIRERVLALIDSEFESDASFERELGIVANSWDLGRRSLLILAPPFTSSVTLGRLLNLSVP